MKTLDVRGGWGNLIRSCIHDIMIYTEGADNIIITDIGSWQDQLDDGEVYHSLRGWLRYYAEEREDKDVIYRINKRIFDLGLDVTLKIRDTLVDIFNFLLPEDKTVSRLLAGWNARIPEHAVYLGLEKCLNKIFINEEKFIKDNFDNVDDGLYDRKKDLKHYKEKQLGRKKRAREKLLSNKGLS
jgi:hypothetical protein